MGVMRGILNRLGWCNPVSGYMRPPALLVETFNTPNQWTQIVQNCRNAILELRESLPDPVRPAETSTHGKTQVIPDVVVSSKAHLEQKYHSEKHKSMIGAISA